MNQQEPIKRLSEQLSKNGIRYQLKKRTESVAMYEQLASYSDTVLAIEVFKIKVMPPNNFVSTPYEKFPSNEDIGKAMGAKSFGGKDKREQAEQYFIKLKKECLEGGLQHLNTLAPLKNKTAKGGINAAFIKLKVAFFRIKSNKMPLNVSAILSYFPEPSCPDFCCFIF